MLFEQYNKLNLSSKQRILIWELKERGLGSEIRVMLMAMLYCLDNKIEFKLSSKYSNIAFEKGWTDYFESFCDECDFWFFGDWHDYYRHHNLTLTKLSNFMLGCYYRKPVQQLSDVWQTVAVRNDDSFHNKQFYIPELQINGDAYHAVQVLAKIIWRIKPEILPIIEQHKNNLNLGHLPYAGLFIRRGDKIKEASYVAVSEYAKKVKELNSDIHRVFIDTDDYRCVEEFKQLNPGWGAIPKKGGIINLISIKKHQSSGGKK